MKTKTLIILAAIAVLGIAGFNLRTKLLHAAAFRSFVATESISTWTVDFPQEALTSSEEVAVREDGSSVRIQPLTSLGSQKNGPLFLRGIYDFKKMRLTVVHPEIKSIVSTRLGAIEVSREYKPAYSCETDVPANQAVTRGKSDGQILGFDVDMSEVLIKDYPPPGPEPHQMTIKTWMAPALGCFVLREESHEDKLVSGNWIRDKWAVVQVSAVTYKPVDSYFEIPSDYVERATGDAAALRTQIYPTIYPPPSPDRVQKLNDIYYKAQ
jgi:hypothetical protein